MEINYLTQKIRDILTLLRKGSLDKAEHGLEGIYMHVEALDQSVEINAKALILCLKIEDYIKNKLYGENPDLDRLNDSYNELLFLSNSSPISPK